METINNRKNIWEISLFCIMAFLITYFLLNSCNQPPEQNIQTPSEYWDSIEKMKQDSTLADSIAKEEKKDTSQIEELKPETLNLK